MSKLKFKPGDTILVVGRECAVVTGKVGVIVEGFQNFTANNSYTVDFEKIDSNKQLHTLTVLLFEDEMEKVSS